MTYWLREDISFCRIDDHLIFLDVEFDRYFKLPDPLEHAFTMHMAGGACDESTVQRLVASKILTADTAPEDRAPAQTIAPPRHSAIEQAADVPTGGLGQLLAVFAIVCATRRQLTTLSLKQILDRLTTYRREHAARSSPTARPASDQQFIDLAGAFWRARLYVPIPTRCLLDSLSMVQFLARRGLTASIVFGVTSDPFSAHCWAQARDLVLTDSVGNVRAYTPIRTV